MSHSYYKSVYFDVTVYSQWSFLSSLSPCVVSRVEYIRPHHKPPCGPFERLVDSPVFESFYFPTFKTEKWMRNSKCVMWRDSDISRFSLFLLVLFYFKCENERAKPPGFSSSSERPKREAVKLLLEFYLSTSAPPAILNLSRLCNGNTNAACKSWLCWCRFAKWILFTSWSRWVRQAVCFF